VSEAPDPSKLESSYKKNKFLSTKHFLGRCVPIGTLMTHKNQ
jgi:hypothetical protein